MTVEAYPLHWPEHYKRKDRWRREQSRFNTGFTTARDGLIYEIEMLRGKHIVLSTNIPLRRDGLPYANQAQPNDAGVAVYFEYKKNSMCFACDRFTKVKDNIQSIRKTIEAIRGIERWGASDMMERAFTGFTALPDPNKEKSWRDVLGCGDTQDIDVVKQNYIILRKQQHPDHGGDSAIFNEIQKAWRKAKEDL